MDIQEAMEVVIGGRDLVQLESFRIMGQILSGKNSDAQVASYLNALHVKGESISEITGSALGVRKKSLQMKVAGGVLDTCGTIGKGVSTFNISTIAAFVVAGCGVKVAKINFTSNPTP